MSKQEFEAERLLNRLKSLDLNGSKRDPARVEAALKALYAVVQQPFPEFRWVPRLQDTVVEQMRAGWARFCVEGAVRTPGYPFQKLNDQVLAAAPTEAFRGAWSGFLQRFEMRCGSEPRDFVEKLSRAGDQARQAAAKALKSEKLNKLQEDLLRKAAAAVVQDAGALIPPAERKDATEALANVARNGAILPTYLLPKESDEWAQWRARHGAEGVPRKDTVPALLHLIDAVDAGLWFFWPSTEAVIAVARPTLR